MATREPQTDDDRIIASLAEHLPRLEALGNGPMLDATTLQTNRRMSVEDTAGTPYGDHLRDLRDILHDILDDLGEYGATETATIENHFDYDVPDCDFLLETDPALFWSEDLLTVPISDADPDKDYEQAGVHHRLVDLRTRGSARLVELHADYYTTGEIHASISITPGYDVSSATGGGDRFDVTHVFSGTLAELDAATVADDLEAHYPYVLSRVDELVGNQDVNMSHARAKALSEAGADNETIADLLDISEGTVRGYKSKYVRDSKRAERRVVGNSPVARDILAVHEFDISNYLGERWYICRTALPDPMGLAEPYSLTVVKEDYDSFGITFDASTSNYESLGSLIRDVYINGEFRDERRAEDVRAAIEAIPKHELDATDIGALPKPTETLHAEVP